MGIKYLENFIERGLGFPSECCYEVKLEQLVEIFHNEKGRHLKPKIVFHFSNVAYFLLKGTDWIHGGQSMEVLNKIGAFINSFKRAGIDPVFFFRGYSDKDAEDFDPKWRIEKRLEEIKTVNEFFACLEKGARTQPCDPRFQSATFEDLSYYFGAMFGCEVHKATTECNFEIVLYARNKENCVGIFAQDSNFIIHGVGKAVYLSAKHFNMETMTTRLYSRRGLASALGIDEWKLPLLGALADKVEVGDRFNRFSNRYNNQRFIPIACYIKQLPFDKQAPHEVAIINIIPHIAKELFSDDREAMEKFLNITTRQFLCTEEPVNLQSDDPNWSKILSKAEELHRANRNPTIIRKILNNQPYDSILGLEDTRNNNLPTSLQVTRPLRQKIYGILLFETPPNPELDSVTEWCIEGPDSTEPFDVESLPPEDDHPGLLALWKDDRSDGLQNKRWSLFAHSISSYLDHNKLRDLPENLIVPAATLLYLWEYRSSGKQLQRKFFETWEIYALIATAIMLDMPSSSFESGGPVLRGVDPRAVHISSMYNKTLNTITDLLAVCGYPLSFEKTFSHPYFNGKLFQKKYSEAKKGASPTKLCDNKISLMAKFRSISKIVFKET